MSSASLIELKPVTMAEPRAKQTSWLGNGNEAVARAILDIGYDAEGYYPITPSADVGEAVSKAYADGKTDIAFVVGTSELAALGICTGVAAPEVRVDVTSRQRPASRPSRCPPSRDSACRWCSISRRAMFPPLNIKNGHSISTQRSAGAGSPSSPTVKPCTT